MPSRPVTTAGTPSARPQSWTRSGQPLGSGASMNIG